MSFNSNQWIPRGLFNEQGSPVYSVARTQGTKFAEALLERVGRRPIDEKTGERPMLVPPPLPRRRSELP